MIDIKFLRENPEVVKENIKKKFQDAKLPMVDEVIELDAESRKTQQEADNLRAERKKISKEIGALMGKGLKDEAEAANQIKIAVDYMKATNECYALVIEKDTFDAYKLQNVEKNDLTMTREEAIQKVAASIEVSACIVSTTGMISRELFEARTAWNQGHERDFLTVGSMGHASQIALGIALQKPERKVYCFDGDGASLMHMGNMAITASMNCKNYVHVVFNNGAHDSVGGQPTVGLKIDLCGVAKAVGYKAIYSVDIMEQLEAILPEVKNAEGPILLQVCVKKGNRKDLGRPTTTPVQNKEALMTFLQD